MTASLWMMTAVMTSAVAAPPEVSLDTTKQLFLDDYLVAERQNVTWRIHPARKHPANPLLAPEQAWEGTVALTHGSVIRDGDTLRMWYLSNPGFSYAESDDGIHWVKPKLDLFEIDGKKTNIVLRRDAKEGDPNAIPFLYNAQGVMKDPRDPDPDRRYKMGFVSIHRDYKGPREDVFHKGQRRGLGVAASPDGFHWKLVDNWATEAVCDGPDHWMFDPARQRWVLYGRTKFRPADVAAMCLMDDWCKRSWWGRSVTRIESDDFVKWDLTEPGTGPVVMTADSRDPIGTEIYSMHVFPYESVYIGLMQVFHNQPERCYLDVQLAVSRDGVKFTRVVNRAAFIPLGGVGEWDRFNHSLANNDPIVVGDELWFYYSGRTYRHGPYKGPDKGVSGGRIGVATIQRDRFVSVGASFDGGEILTRRMKLAGTTIHLNAKSDYGEIVVEVLSKDDSLIARSKPIQADALDIPIEWETGDLNEVNSPITLRITLKNALLFAVWAS